MASTQVKSKQIADGEIKREDINTTETGKAIITKVVAGSNINISSTGIDAGTGDVTVNLSSDVSTNSVNIATGQAYKINSSTVLDETNGADKLDGYHATDFTLLLSTNTTKTVKTSGGDFTNLQDALNYIKDKWINTTDALYTITIEDGDFTSSSEYIINHPCSSRIIINGQNTYSKVISSVQSSSGSSGAWSVILNLDSVTNIAVGDYVLIRGDLTGGTNPLFLAGCHKISNVDTGNNRITVDIKTLVSSMASGATVSTITIIKTKLKMTGCNGFNMQQRLYSFDKIVIVGDETSNTSGIYSEKEEGHMALGANVGIVDFDYNIYLTAGIVQTSSSASYLCLSNAVTNGIYNDGSGVIYGGIFVINGSGGSGIISKGRSFLHIAVGATIIGNNSHGIETSNRGVAISTSNNILYNNGDGCNAINGGQARVESAILSYNTNNGITCGNDSYVFATSATCNNNGNNGFYAEKYGYILADSSTATGNATANYSPTVNTQGNEYGYIDT